MIILDAGATNILCNITETVLIGFNYAGESRDGQDIMIVGRDLRNIPVVVPVDKSSLFPEGKQPVIYYGNTGANHPFTWLTDCNSTDVGWVSGLSFDEMFLIDTKLIPAKIVRIDFGEFPYPRKAGDAHNLSVFWRACLTREADGWTYSEKVGKADNLHAFAFDRLSLSK